MKINYFISGARLLIGFVIPAAVFGIYGTEYLFYLYAMVGIGELIDRCEFYIDLDLITPKKKMAGDLLKALDIKILEQEKLKLKKQPSAINTKFF